MTMKIRMLSYTTSTVALLYSAIAVWGWTAGVAMGSVMLLGVLIGAEAVDEVSQRRVVGSNDAPT